MKKLLPRKLKNLNFYKLPDIGTRILLRKKIQLALPIFKPPIL